MPLANTCTPFRGGIAAVSGVKPTLFFRFIGTWTLGDKFTVVTTDNFSGLQYTFGAGDLSGKIPTFVFTYNDKVYALCAAQAFMSAIGLPTVFNDPNAEGNGDVTMSDFMGAACQLVAVEHFQGRLAFFSRQNVQIWQTNADPGQWTQQQILQNIGVLARNSVKALGDDDVLFLSDTGIRSLRPRVASLNADVADIGSAIDLIVQTAISGANGAEANACGIVDPQSGRYWLYLNGVIYVLSYYPDSKIEAWSTYLPTDDAGTTHSIQKFALYKGQVFARTATTLLQYGGASKFATDATVATVELPWLDGKKPATIKQGTGLDAAFQGTWAIEAAMNARSAAPNYDYITVFNDTHDSFDMGWKGYSGQGTHFKLRATSSGTGTALLSSLILHYNEGNEE